MSIATLADITLFDVKTINEEFEGKGTEHELVGGIMLLQYTEKAGKAINISFRIKEEDMNTLKDAVGKKTTYTDIYGRDYNVYFSSLAIKEIPPITDFRDGEASLRILKKSGGGVG